MAIVKKITDGTGSDADDVNWAADLFTEGKDILRIYVTSADKTDAYSTSFMSHLLYNFGSTDCYVAFDESATTSKYLIPAATLVSFDGQFTTLHAITSSGTTYLACLGLK